MYKTMKKSIVIIGAGYSGTLTAKKLAKKLHQEEVEITLIDKNPFHTMLTELHEVAAGRVDESGIKLDLGKIFNGRKVNVILDTVNEIDFEKQVVKGTNNSYPYDYLVLSAGSRPNYFGISGAQEYTYSLWSYEAAIRLNERINASFRRAQSTTEEAERRKLLSFWVIGAGFSGVEMISELAEYVPILCEKYGIAPEEISLYSVDGLSRVVPNLSEKLSAKAERKLQRMGIQVLLNTKVDSIGEDYICLKMGEDIKRYDAGTVVWTAGIQSEAVVQQASQVLEGNRGRIQVNAELCSITNKHVYIVGDNMFYIPSGEKNPVPQMVENCEQSSHLAANNIACEITGKGTKEEYHPKFHGVVVSIGSKDGIASIGATGKMQLSGFLAIAAKHAIYLLYFLQVLGWNKIYYYLRDEIFSVKNQRSLMGGHLSYKIPNLFLVPLRIWVGYLWLYAGITGTATLGFAPANGVDILEVILGIALLGGLFTTPAAIFSIVLQIIMRKDLGWSSMNTWMIFAGIALLPGTGRSLGLDYYVMPLLKKWWANLPFVRKWYLYHD